MYEETTRSITVTVEPIFLEDQSNPGQNHFVWAYHVRIENKGARRCSCATAIGASPTRVGRIQEVRGAGVVGEQPVLRAGRQLRIHQRHAAAHALGHHGRQLQMEASAGERFDDRHSRLLPRQPPSDRQPQLIGRVRAG